MTDPFIKILFLLLLLEFSDLIASLITAIICFFLPTSANDKKRKELMAVKKNLHEELNETNMMDEFAKHAKLKRKIDAVSRQISALTSQTSRKVKINKIVKKTLSFILNISIIRHMYLHATTAILTLDSRFTAGWVLRSLNTLRLSEVTGSYIQIGTLFWAFICRSCIKTFRSFFSEYGAKLKNVVFPEKQLKEESLD